MRLRPVSRSLAVCAAAVLVPLLSLSAKAQKEDFAAYDNSNYGFCDAKKVAHVWKKNIGEAKAIIGAKIRANIEALIQQDIRSTANSVQCSWVETDLSFNDAEKLARYWGRSIGDAKTKAKIMVSEHGTHRFREIMKEALSG